MRMVIAALVFSASVAPLLASASQPTAQGTDSVSTNRANCQALGDGVSAARASRIRSIVPDESPTNATKSTGFDLSSMSILGNGALFGRLAQMANSNYLNKINNILAGSGVQSMGNSGGQTIGGAVSGMMTAPKGPYTSTTVSTPGFNGSASPYSR